MEDGSQQQCTIGQCSPWASLESGSGSSKVTWQRGVRTGIGTMCGHSVIYYPQLFQPAVCRKTESQFQTRTDQSRGIQIKADDQDASASVQRSEQVKNKPQGPVTGNTKFRREQFSYSGEWVHGSHLVSEVTSDGLLNPYLFRKIHF